MKRLLKVLAVVILISGIAAGGFFFYKTTTPEYALLRTIQDVDKNGYDGLKEHLSEKALDKVNSIETLSDQTGLSSLIDKLTHDNTAGFLKDKMSEITWTVENVQKSNDQANAVIRFSYDEKVYGTIQIIMLRDGVTWKIDSFRCPRVTDISLW